MENTLILHRTPNQDPAALILPPVVKGGNSLVSTVRLINITSTEYILDKLDKTHETFTNSLLKLNKYYSLTSPKWPPWRPKKVAVVERWAL